LVKEEEKQLGLRGSGPGGFAAVTLWQIAQAIFLFPEFLWV
jgi:hypothetical protein